MISLLVPTRNRPDNLRRLHKSIKESVDDLQDIEICFCVDEDDDVSLPIITEIAQDITTQCIQGEPAPNVRVPIWFLENSLQKQATGPIFMFSSDDIMYRTKGWDTIVKKKFDQFEDKIALVYGPDGFQTGKVPVCTHGFLHQHWIDVVGYLMPSHFNVGYCDTWITEIAEAVGRRIYVPEMYIEHIHPAAGKASWDSTYTTKQESEGGELNIWNNTKYERLDIIERLKKYIALFK